MAFVPINTPGAKGNVIAHVTKEGTFFQTLEGYQRMLADMESGEWRGKYQREYAKHRRTVREDAPMASESMVK